MPDERWAITFVISYPKQTLKREKSQRESIIDSWKKQKKKQKGLELIEEENGKNVQGSKGT